MSETKEKILLTALRLFAQDGYEAVSVSMIAGELGITKGALYKHYKNKQDIFDCIIERMHQIDQARSEEHGQPIDTYDNAPDTYQNVSIEEDMEFTKKYFRFWTQDEFGVNFRRMLTIEQFRNQNAKEMRGMVMGNGLFEYTAHMFQEWMKEGVLKEDDPYLLALESCGPFHFLISLSDTTSDVKHLESLLDALIERFLKANMVPDHNKKNEIRGKKN